MSKKRRKSNKRKKVEFNRIVKFELIGLILITLSIISLARLGVVGHATVSFFRFFFGEWYVIGLIALFIFACYLMWKREIPPLAHPKLIGVYIIILAILLLSHITLFELISRNGQLENNSVITNTAKLFFTEVRGGETTIDLGGGMIGALLFAVFYFLFDEAGAKITAFITIMFGFVLITGKPIGEAIGKGAAKLIQFLKRQTKVAVDDVKSLRNERKEKRQQAVPPQVIEEDDSAEAVLQELIITPPQQESGTGRPNKEGDTVEETHDPVISSFEEAEKQTEQQADNDEEKERESVDVEETDTILYEEVENVDYELPPLSLLKQPYQTDQSGEYKQIHTNAAKLERTFQSFGVKARVTQVHLGPAVTKYEVHPDAGVKVSKIVSLSDDLALALAAKDIRIEAPIPGKSAIGIEVPNSEIAMVSLKEVLEARPTEHPDDKLLIGLGRDVTGNAVLSRLNKMPHLLIAGATGSGKSVCINGIIISILMRTKPHEVKMMMIDPKMVELSVYNGVPHLLAPVVTDPRKASQALQKVVSEMERRYELFTHTGTRNIEGYNDYIQHHNEGDGAKQVPLPYIVVIVDELSDLMMVASSDVEDSITRLAQMARAAGIHLIIATQRPSVDVITGVIKANIPSRIAFAVSSATDSRTIIDMGGAEKLLGRGDMLFLPVGASKPLRVQGAYLTDKEVEEIVDFVISQQKAQYQEEMIPDEKPLSRTEVQDELFDEAVQLIAEMQTASVSMLQRRFRIGYTRAARLIDAMEDRGMVGPYEGSKPRTVLIPKPTADEALNQ